MAQVALKKLEEKKPAPPKESVTVKLQGKDPMEGCDLDKIPEDPEEDKEDKDEIELSENLSF